MNKQIIGKKLLVLGGMIRTKFLVERAKKLGVYVIVADNNIDAPAKKIAHQAILLDATSICDIVSFCKENQVDGIISAHTDLLLRPWFEAAKKLNLPCYLTEEMIEVSTNKDSFNTMCRRFGVPVPKTYDIDESIINEQAEKLKYPVFIKPLDGSGSRGASACDDKKDFIKKYQYAKRFSKQGKVIVEEKLTGVDVGLDYLIYNGEAHLLSMTDRKICSDRPSAVNHANLQILPSKYLNDYLNKLDFKVKEMLMDMNFKNGIIFFQGFANAEGITFFEMGCRFGGTWNYIDEYFHGVNPLDMLIEFSLTGSMPKERLLVLNPMFKGYGAVVSLLTNKKEGLIYEVKGVDKIKEKSEIKCIMQEYDVGDHFSLENQSDISLIRIQLASNSFERLIQTINYIYNTVDFIDKNGKSLLSNFYSTDLLEYL